MRLYYSCTHHQIAVLPVSALQNHASETRKLLPVNRIYNRSFLASIVRRLAELSLFCRLLAFLPTIFAPLFVSLLHSPRCCWCIHPSIATRLADPAIGCRAVTLEHRWLVVRCFPSLRSNWMTATPAWACACVVLLFTALLSASATAGSISSCCFPATYFSSLVLLLFEISLTEEISANVLYLGSIRIGR